MTTPQPAQSDDPSILPQVVTALLDASGLDAQRQILAEADLLSADGMGALLSYVQAQVGEDPARSRTLAQICHAFAPEVDAAALAPMARYFQAQTYAMNGEFELAYGLIEEARGGFEAIGDTGGALRTNLGLMNVLGELGRHAEAVAAGNRVLEAVAPQFARADAPPDLHMMAAGVQANLGVCFSQMGQFDAALDAYNAAEAHYATVGQTERAASVLNNRGITLLYLGQVRGAIELFERAAQARRAADLTVLEAQTQANLGEAYLLLGDFERALQALEAARRTLRQVPAAADLVIVTRKLGDAYLALNLVDEAVEAYSEALSLAAGLGMAHQQGWIEWGLGAAYSRAGQLAEARGALARAAAFFGGLDNRPLLSSVRLEEAAVLYALGEQSAAREQAQTAWDLVSDSSWRVQQLYAALRLVDLAAPDAAEHGQARGTEPGVTEWLERARLLAQELDLPRLTYRVDARAGRHAWEQGDSETAESLLLAAIENLETVRGTVAQEALRTSFLEDKTTVYGDLLRLYLARAAPGDLESAFAVVERSQSRVLVDLLQGLVTRAVELEETEQAALDALQADLDALYNRLLEGNSGSEERGSAPAAVVALEQSIRHMRLRAVARTPHPGMPDAGRPTQELAVHSQTSRTNVEVGQGTGLGFELAQLQAGLGAREAVVVYFVLDDTIGAFVVDREQLQVVRSLVSVGEIQIWLGRLEIQWERFRVGAAFVQAHLGQLARSAQRVLGQLYSRLWETLIPQLPVGVERITVVPQGILHQIPFHALHDGDDYLIARHVFTYAPSATVHQLCRARAARGLEQAVVTGVDDPQLPFVAVEARQVADLFPQAVELVGAQATQAELRRALARRAGVVHLACHGLFRSDNPVYSALKLADGWLTAVEMLGLPLEGALVVLSACESGRSRMVPGNELLGIPRAVLGAGARNAVVSQWVVQDEAAAELMVEFYRSLAQENARADEDRRNDKAPVADVAGALRDAQRGLAVRYPHPYFWAAFMVMGAG